MKETLGILGYSDIARRRIIPGLYNSNRFILSAIGTRNPSRTNDLSIPLLTYDALFGSKEIDTIYISTPPSMHYEHAIRALKNNKNIIVEKPAVLNTKHLESIINLAKEKGLYFIEALSFEYHPVLKYLNTFFTEIKSSTKEVVLTFRFPELSRDNIRNNKSLGGGIANDNLIYPLVLLQYLNVNIVELNNYLNHLLHNQYDVPSGLYYSMVSDGIVFHIMVGMGYSYKNSIEFITGDSVFKIPKLFSLKPNESAQLIKNDTVIKRLECCDQVTLMFDSLLELKQEHNYYKRMFERTKLLEELNKM